MIDNHSSFSLLTLVSIIAGGIVSILQLLEYLVTKNIPWIFRFIRNILRKVRRMFWTARDSKERFLLLNFSGHPVLPGQEKKIRHLMAWPKLEIIDVPMGSVKEDENFLKIAIRKVDDLDLLPDEWQRFSLVVLPAGYSPLWSALLAEIHGRLGHFPDVVRLRPAKEEREKYEVAEILDLRDIRHQARAKR